MSVEKNHTVDFLFVKTWLIIDEEFSLIKTWQIEEFSMAETWQIIEEEISWVKTWKSIDVDF